MAHTPQQPDETRPHPRIFDVGTRIGVRGVDGVVKATIHNVDEGGWIYPDYDTGQNTAGLPGWLRATQVFKLED